MIKKPFFSIIIPTYNRASNLQFALYCIFRQNFSDFEIIISDNCSTDNTKDIISKLKDKKIHYFRNKINLNLALNIKNAMKHAKGKYIFLHGDDDILFYPDSLRKIYEKIRKYNLGYIRVSYMCIASDRRRIFYFKVNRPFVKDEYLLPLSDNKKVLSFILNSDHYFITGTIFKNSLPTNVEMLKSEHAPWMAILFYSAKIFGAYFIAESHIAASWSQWRNKQNGFHPIYNLINGKLESENYFNVVQEKLNKKDYDIFLYSQLMTIYVRLFPLIKILIGNKNLLQFSKRIRVVDPIMRQSISYWAYLIGALIFPRFFLKFVKNTYLYIYIRLSKVDNDKEIVNRLRELELGFFHARENISRSKDSIFKF